MYIIGENIHIISEKVKEALVTKDAKFFQELAVKQVEAGAQALDLNLGPRKKDGEEVFPWIVQTVEAVVDVPLSFDSTNILGIEAGINDLRAYETIALGAVGGFALVGTSLLFLQPSTKQLDRQIEQLAGEL